MVFQLLLLGDMLEFVCLQKLHQEALCSTQQCLLVIHLRSLHNLQTAEALARPPLSDFRQELSVQSEMPELQYFSYLYLSLEQEVTISFLPKCSSVLELVMLVGHCFLLCLMRNLLLLFQV